MQRNTIQCLTKSCLKKLKVKKLLSWFLPPETKQGAYSIYCFQNNQLSDLIMEFITPSPDGGVEPCQRVLLALKPVGMSYGFTVSVWFSLIYLTYFTLIVT